MGTNTVDVNVFNGDTAALKRFANPVAKPKEETDVQSGSLNNGASAVTAIAIPFGSAKEIGFACDNGRQGLPTANCGWRSGPVNGRCTTLWWWTARRARPCSNSLTRPGRQRSRSSVSIAQGNVSVGYQVS